MIKITRRAICATSLALPFAGLAKPELDDPIIGLSKRYWSLVDEFDAIEQSNCENVDEICISKVRDLNAAFERVASMQVNSAKGLKAQFEVFMHKIGNEAKEGYTESWAVIFDNMQKGIEGLK